MGWRTMRAQVLGLLVLCCAVRSEDDLSNKRVSELKRMLIDRGVKCLGCTEKEHLVAKVRESLDLPIIRKQPEDDEDETDSVQQDLKGFQMPKNQFMETLRMQSKNQGHAFDEKQMEDMWKSFNSQLKSGKLKKDKNGNLNYKVDVDPSDQSFVQKWNKMRDDNQFIYWSMFIFLGMKMLEKWLKRRKRQQEALEAETQTTPEASKKDD